MNSRALKTGRQPRSREPADLFRAIAESIPHMLWMARADGAVEYVNARTLEFTGCSASELKDWGWKPVIHPEDLAICVQRWRRALSSGKGFEAEYRLRRADGKYRWHHHHVLPSRDGAGRIIKWFVTCTDIDDRKRAAQRLEHARQTLESLVAARTQSLAESGERLRAFLDSMPAIAWIKDSRLRYTWLSASYTRIHGISRSEVLGRDDFEIWPQELARHFRRGDEKTLRAKGPVQMVDTVPLLEGRPARWLVVKFPLPDGTGAPGIAGIRFDITARDADEFGEIGNGGQQALESLSGRELQVLRLTVEGCTSAEIATQLGLSPKSVDTYRSRLMAKLEIEDLPALVKFAIRSGLTTSS